MTRRWLNPVNGIVVILFFGLLLAWLWQPASFFGACVWLLLMALASLSLMVSVVLWGDYRRPRYSDSPQGETPVVVLLVGNPSWIILVWFIGSLLAIGLAANVICLIGAGLMIIVAVTCMFGTPELDQERHNASVQDPG